MSEAKNGNGPVVPEAPAREMEEGFSGELSDKAPRLRLDKFEGPFEVLLYLIRAQEIDIFDIPIQSVTEQYLAFLDLLHEENLDVAGEFLVMAATLIHIKSKMILPLELDDEEEEIEEEDPRLELVEKLLAYRKYRDLAQKIGEFEEQRADRYARRVKPQFEGQDEDEDEYIEVSLYDLVRAIRGVLRFVLQGAFHHVAPERVSVDEKIERIAQILEERESVSWTDLYRECTTKTDVVCYLLAILELCRMGRIRAHQHRAFGEIRIFARDPQGEPFALGMEATAGESG